MAVFKPARRWVRLTSLVVGLIWAGVATGDENQAEETSPVSLASGRSTGDVVRVRASLEVGGDLSLATSDQPRKLPMSVVAKFGYEERMLAAEDGLRSLRHYHEAEAALKVGEGGFKPSLDEKRRTIITRWLPGASPEPGTTMFSNEGPLTRAELDLIDIMGSSLVVELLLPDEPVVLGESWKHSDQAIAALLRLDTLARCDVQSALGGVVDEVAKIAIAGTVHGTTEGVPTEIELKGSYDFSLTHRCITRLHLVVKEKRSAGYVAPGLDVVAKLKMQIEPLEVAEHLTDEALAKISTEATPLLTRLVHLGPREDFRLTHDRHWYVTNDEPSVTVFRRIHRGELVTQCNISELPRKSAERHISLAEFRKDIRFALGDRFGKFVEAGQWADKAGNRVFRVVAQGEVEELPIEWRYYLIASKSGRRLAISFTVEGPLTERLGDADRRLVAAVELLDAKPSVLDATPETASKPSPEKTKSKKQ